MKRCLLLNTIAFAIITIWTAPGGCHGVAGSINPSPGYLVTAMYDDGEPMSYASVEIKAPDSKTAFQLGRTDRNGVMMFQPDLPGRWQAVVSDGMGHQLTVEVEVAVEASNEAQEVPQTVSPTHPGGSRVQGVVTGLALIFGISGLAYGWLGRRKVQQP